MPLPEICPLDGISRCKTSECHLYHVDWRSDEENCSIGYSSNQPTPFDDNSLQDNYVQTTRARLGRDIEPIIEIKKAARDMAESIEKESAIQKQVPDDIAVEPADVSDNDKKEKRAGKSIDDAMKLDLPDDYEEEFWS